MKRQHSAIRRSIQPSGANGFALVATLMLLLLLSLLALGMLSLSSISLRSTSRSAGMAEAQANARMALMLAIGELQRQTGPDTRVTAQAEVAETGAPPLTGVWKSWEGTDHDGTGRPIKPDYASKNASAQSGSGRFLTWLVSGARQGPTQQGPSELVSTKSAAGTVPLLAEGSLGDKPGQVHVKPQLVKNDMGAYAWWVSPENQKARLLQPHKPRTDAIAGWVEAGQSHSIPDAGVFGLDGLASDPEKYVPDAASSKQASRGITLNTTGLLVNNNPKEPQHSFHDLSTNSVGLLTNTATGGWRKDLSVLTERWDSIYASYPGGKLPLFRFSPATGATSLVPKPAIPNLTLDISNTGAGAAAVKAATPNQSNLYPWSDYSLILPGNSIMQPNTYQAASASWQSLVSFATSYKNFALNADSLESPFAWDVVTGNLSEWQVPGIPKVINLYNFKHVQRLHPQIARFQSIIYAKADPVVPATAPPKYNLKLMFVPIITLWNPYNVGLTDGPYAGVNEELLISYRRSMPINLAVVNQATGPWFSNPSLVPNSSYRYLTPGNIQYTDVAGNWAADGIDHDLATNAVTKGYPKSSYLDLRSFGASLPPGKLTFKPGEAKVFSPRLPGHVHWSGSIRLTEGFNQDNILGFEFTGGSNLLASARYWFLMKNDRVTKPYKGRSPGMGFDLTFGKSSGPFYQTHPSHVAVQQPFHSMSMLAPADSGSLYWPPTDVDEVGYSIGELASGAWIPIFSVSMGPRTTIGTPSGTEQNRPTKGLLQSNPLASMSMVDPISGDPKAHPANGTFDITYHSMSIGSSITPNLSAGKGFIATGYQSGDGLSRLIMCNIPLRPMASIVELEGWNPRGNNPYPPFQANLIGNSDSTPLMPADGIVPSTLAPATVQTNLMHDDAYCANHLLFDDWFVSSIAPQPKVLGGDIAKSIDTVYREYLKGEFKLSNRAYRPIADDSSVSDSVASTRVTQVLNSADGWLKMGSRFEVEGMFNVNSTSVEAWKAILGHARNREEIAMNGKDGIISVAPKGDHPVTRGAVASDVEAGSGAAIGGGGPKASEYAGFRSLSDDDIADLAEKVVEQVKLRGPFLSLSEFVNRQLSNKEDLALAGALQTAINNLDNDPMKVLRNPANSLSDKTMSVNDPKLAGVNYAFAKAAEGDSAYGAPGWIRQADVLRPIAPILSARDDTFTIRAYGDARDGNGNIVATAWCEATVQRTREFVDTQDAADSIDPPARQINQLLGRKYVLRTFRWLNFDEV